MSGVFAIFLNCSLIYRYQKPMSTETRVRGDVLVKVKNCMQHLRTSFIYFIIDIHPICPVADGTTKKVK